MCIASASTAGQASWPSIARRRNAQTYSGMARAKVSPSRVRPTTARHAIAPPLPGGPGVANGSPDATFRAAGIDATSPIAPASTMAATDSASVCFVASHPRRPSRLAAHCPNVPSVGVAVRSG